MRTVDGVVAAILAGGEGKRFRPYTDIIPKPMMPLGNEEQPLLEHIVRWLSRFGVRDIVLLVGYRWKQIRNYFRDGSHIGVRIRFSVDSEGYRGTGGALVRARRLGLLEASDVLVWYGDIVAELDVGELVEAHRSWGADVTLVVADRYQVPVGVAEVDREGNVTRLEEKPWLPLKVTIGILVVKPSVLDWAEERLGRSFDVMGDMIPELIRSGRRVKAFIYHGDWYDVGSLERYQKLPEERFPLFLGG